MNTPELHHAREIAEKHFGINAVASYLDSEWGGTFRLNSGNDQNYILKIAPDFVDPSRTDLEISALLHLESHERPFNHSKIIRTTDGAVSGDTDFGTARIYTWIDGRLWSW